MDEIQQSTEVETTLMASESKLVITEKLDEKSMTKLQEEQSVFQESIQNDEMAKEDYIKILELLRRPTFLQMMDVLTVKESVIISLKLGYIDGKCFSTESIAKFLEIENDEVIETTKKVLLLYRDSINNFLDEAIEVVKRSKKK